MRNIRDTVDRDFLRLNQPFSAKKKRISKRVQYFSKNLRKSFYSCFSRFQLVLPCEMHSGEIRGYFRISPHDKINLFQIHWIRDRQMRVFESQ